MAQSLSWLGDEVATVALLLRLQSHGHGAGSVATLLIANALPIVALSGVVGRLVDRYDNRRLLVASGLLQAGVCAAVASVSSVPAVLGLVALLGAGQAVNGTCWRALLATVADGDALPRAMGRSQAGRTVAGIAAPALSGLLVGRFGAGVPLLLDAVAYVGVSFVAMLVATRRAGAVAHAGASRPRGGLAIVRADGVLRPLFVLVGTFVLLASMVNVVEVFLVRGTLHASTTWYGLVGAALSAGALAGALLGGRLRGERAMSRSFVVSAGLLAVGLAGIGVAPSVGWVMVGSAVVGLTNGVLNVAVSSLAMLRTAADERGRVSALLTGVVSGTQILALAAGGTVSAWFTPREVFVAAGVLGLLAPLLLARPLLRAASLGPVAGSRAACLSATGPTPVAGFPQAGG